MKTDRINRVAMLVAILAALPTFAAPASAQWSSGWADRVNNVLEIRQQKYGSVDRKFGVNLFEDYGDIAFDHDTDDSIKSYRDAVAIGQCIVGAEAQETRRALETIPGSAASSPTFDRLFATAQGCGSKKLERQGLRRGILSESAYLAANPNAPILPSMPDVARLKAFREAEFERNKTRHENEQIIGDITNCLVMSNLSLADRLARSTHGQDEEQALLDAMFETAPYCAGPTRPEKLGKSFIRAFLMESLYRATIAATDDKL